MHFIAFSGQMHRDREEGASSALLYKRASRCQHVSSLSRLNKTILAHYSRFNKIATLGYIMAHEGMGTDHYSMSRLTMRRSHSSTGYCYNEEAYGLPLAIPEHVQVLNRSLSQMSEV